MNKKEIEHWLTIHNVENYIINEDLTVDVNDNVNLYRHYDIDFLPFKFRNIKGYFDVSKILYLHNNSLDNFPDFVDGDLFMYSNEITKLPKTIWTGYLDSDPFDELYELYAQIDYCEREKLTYQQVQSFLAQQKLEEELPINNIKQEKRTKI